MTLGWIYILINPALPQELLKIGKTTQRPEARAGELSSSTGVPTPYHVAYEVCVVDCDEAERIIHEKLTAFRYSKNKEFFSLPLRQAIAVAEKVAKRVGVVSSDTDRLSTIPAARMPSEASNNNATELAVEEYVGSRLMRRCGQLGILYADVISSPYAKKRGWRPGQFEIQYRDGVNGTVGWGSNKIPMPDRRTTPHSYDEMLRLLGLSK